MNEMEYYKSNIEEWDYKELGEVVCFEGGSQPPKKNFSDVGLMNYIRLIQIRDYKTEKYKTYIPIEMAKRFCDKTDIMIGRYGPPIFQILRGLEGAYNVALLKVIPNESKVYKEYLYYFIKNEHLFRLIDSLSQRTSGQTGVDMEVLKKYIIPLPKLKEQQKISLILSSVDEKIENTDNLIEKTKELKKGLMQRLLTKGIGHDRFKDTEIGMIPEEWEVKKLFDVAEFNNGKSHEQNISEFGDYVVVNSKFVSSEGKIRKYTSDNVCPLEKEHIVLVMSDLPNGKALGKCYLIETDNLYSLNQRICSLKALELDSVYLFYYLNRNKYFLKYDDGVKQTNLRKSEVLDCPVLVPCFNEQKQIVSILSSVDEQIEEYKSKKEKLQELKKGLMQKLLTGKIRVRV